MRFLPLLSPGRKRGAWLIAGGLALGTRGCIGSHPLAQRSTDPVIWIATGTPQQPYHAVGQGLAALIRQRMGKRAVAVITDGSAANARFLRRDERPWVNRDRIVPGPPAAPPPGGRATWQPARFKVGFVNATILCLPELSSHPRREHPLQALAVLWDEYLQLVLSPMLGRRLPRPPTKAGSIKALQEILAKRRIYLGPQKSGSRPIALDLLGALGVMQRGFSDATATQGIETGEAAATALSKGQIDAAIFEPQDEQVGQQKLLEQHECAEEIRIQTNLREWRGASSEPKVPIPLHPGAKRFWDEQREALLIAAGPLGGTSFRLGMEIAQIMSERLGRPARVVNVELSPIQMQRRLLTGQITSGILTAGVPMDVVTEMLQPRSHLVPRLQRAIEAHPRARCAWCGHEIPTPLSIRVLPLDVPELRTGYDPGREAESILGLVTNELFFKYSLIPASTYRASQKETAQTVSVDGVLICRKDTPEVAQITSALVEEEVRLSRVVRGIHLRDPLRGDEPSIPLHPQARRYYEAQGIVNRPPPRPQPIFIDLLKQVASQPIGLLAGLLTGGLTSFLGGRRSKKKKELEKALQANFYGPGSPQERLEGLNATREAIRDAVRNGELKPGQADELDRLFRDYRQELQGPAPAQV
jgi:TRAP-type uncharacterized transport system substrate-binding protein